MDKKSKDQARAKAMAKKELAGKTRAAARGADERIALLESHLRAMRHYLDPEWVERRTAEHQTVIDRETKWLEYHHGLQAGAREKVARMEANLAEMLTNRRETRTNPLARKLVKMRAEIRRLEREIAAIDTHVA